MFMQQKSLVVITDASQGIGKALVKKFLADNHPCLLLSRHIEPVEELRRKDVIYEQADVADYRALKSAIEKAERKYGHTECLINNAGMIRVGAFREMPIEKCHLECLIERRYQRDSCCSC